VKHKPGQQIRDSGRLSLYGGESYLNGFCNKGEQP
jgi:hypothetical protein